MSRKHDTPTTDEIRQYLSALWCSTLAVDSVAADDDFINLGGDSMKMIRMLAAVSAQFGGAFEFHPFFERRTIEVLSAVVAAGPISDVA